VVMIENAAERDCDRFNPGDFASDGNATIVRLLLERVDHRCVER
jgi:hypothetical protein